MEHPDIQQATVHTDLELNGEQGLRRSPFSVFMVVSFYKGPVNTELGNTQPALPGGMWE